MKTTGLEMRGGASEVGVELRIEGHTGLVLKRQRPEMVLANPYRPIPKRPLALTRGGKETILARDLALGTP